MTENRICDVCQVEYLADTRNLKRGWGLCCSKSCAAKKRESLKPGYDPIRAARNRRIRLVKATIDDMRLATLPQKTYWNFRHWNRMAPEGVGDGIIEAITTEGYRVVNGIAYNDDDEPEYNYELIDEDDRE